MLQAQKAQENQSRKVYIKTYGCQMNVYDSEKMEQLLQGCNYQVTSDITSADLIILNTCSIREKPEHKVYSILGRLKKIKDNNPHVILGVGGCVAQQQGAKLFEKSTHLDLVFGTHSINKLPSLLKELEAGNKQVCETGMYEDGYHDHAVYGEPSSNLSSYVSIIRGCNNFCSFCVVPFVRGRERSRPKDEIIDEVVRLAERGVKEVVLLGQNVNSYGNDSSSDGSFSQLLARINEVRGIERIRFTTSHPKDLSDSLIDSFKELNKLCEHIHLPVQSGSNAILQLMNRGYTHESYREKVEKLRSKCPDIGITSDVIVGFPQETEKDFEATLALVKEIQFDDLFSFQYSDRPMTAASRFSEKVIPSIKAERLKILQKVQNECSLGNNKKTIGNIEEVLVEGTNKKDPCCLTGKTRSNKTVNFIGDDSMKGKMVSVKITNAHHHSLSGELIEYSS